MFSVLQGIFLGVELLGHIFNLLKNCQTVFHSNYTFCIPISSKGEFQCLHVLLILAIIWPSV